ncbi:MAG: antitoxin [Nakamurella sp.]
MRTTITLDPDVEALLHKLMSERGLTFKDAVNGLLRSALTPPNASRVDFSFPTYNMGEPVLPLEHALRVAADLEDEEIIRRMSVGR